MVIKPKPDKKIKLMQKYKKEYDSTIGPFGENRSDGHFEGINFEKGNEIFLNKTGENISEID